VSIVERAIDKVRAKGASPAEQRSVGATAEAGAAAVALRTPEPPAERVRVVPSRTIALPREALVAAGVLPTAELVPRFREEFGRIRWKLTSLLRERALGGPSPRMCMVASSLPGEGKTFVSMNLALALASAHQSRVLLVDADVAKGHVSKLLGCDGDLGLTDALRGDDVDVARCVVATDVTGLELLPRGTAYADGPDLFLGRRLDDVLDRLLDEPDRLVLFDSSPLLLTTESAILARHVGQILLVIRAETTPQEVVREALQNLGQDAPVACLLNQVPRAPLAGYGGSYYDSYYDAR
jgi:Mrp family chromosome partitioning ATPase